MLERISFTDCSDPPIPCATDFILDSWQSGKVSADPDQGRRQKVSKSSLEDEVSDDDAVYVECFKRFVKDTYFCLNIFLFRSFF